MDYRQNAYVEPVKEPEVIIDPKRFLPKHNPSNSDLKWGAAWAMAFVWFIMMIVVVALSDKSDLYDHSSGARSDCFESHIWKHKEHKTEKRCNYSHSEDCMEWISTPICDIRFHKNPTIVMTKAPPIPFWALEQ